MMLAQFKKNLLLAAILLISSLQVNAWMSYAILSSTLPPTNKPVILLGHNKRTNQWEAFSINGTGTGTKGNELATQAVRDQTNNVYTINLQDITIWKRDDATGDLYHLIPVKYISGRALYLQARNNVMDDFFWADYDDLINKKPIIHPRKGQIDTFINTQMLQKLIPQASAPTPAADQDTWKNIPGAIYFYTRGNPYFEFTNFYESPIDIDGIIWPTTEHYYQAQKFTDPKIQEQIRGAKTASEVFKFAQANKNLVRGDWQKISLDTMLTALRAKFSQHKNLEKILLDTNDKILIEDAGKNDAFYGAGADYKGENHLGQMLMHVRDELHKGRQAGYISQPVSYFRLKTTTTDMPQEPKKKSTTLTNVELTIELQKLSIELNALKATITPKVKS